MVGKWDVWFVWWCNGIVMVTLWSLNEGERFPIIWSISLSPSLSLSFYLWVKCCFPRFPLFGFYAHSIRASPDLNWLLGCLPPSCLARKDSAFHQVRKSAYGLCWIGRLLVVGSWRPAACFSVCSVHLCTIFADWVYGKWRSYWVFSIQRVYCSIQQLWDYTGQLICILLHILLQNIINSWVCK